MKNKIKKISKSMGLVLIMTFLSLITANGIQKMFANDSQNNENTYNEEPNFELNMDFNELNNPNNLGITFNDYEFKKFIWKILRGKNNNEVGNIYKEDILMITRLTINNTDITDLSDLIHFDNLETLIISNNSKLESIDISNIDSLTFFESYRNGNLNSVKLTGLNSLRSVDINYNDSLESIEFADCSNLLVVQCGLNSNLSQLNFSEVDNLYYLWTPECNLSSLDLSNVVNLQNLHCGSNKLTSLDISNLNMLTHLTCSDNYISDLKLSHSSEYEYLDVSYNHLTPYDITVNENIDFYPQRKIVKNIYTDNNLIPSKGQLTVTVDSDYVKEGIKVLAYRDGMETAIKGYTDADAKVVLSFPENTTDKYINFIIKAYDTSNSKEGFWSEKTATVTLKTAENDSDEDNSGGDNSGDNNSDSGNNIIPNTGKYITVESSEGGRAYSSLIYASNGDIIKLFSEPNKGYKFVKWHIVNGGIDIANNQFTMKDNSVFIRAIFEKTNSTDDTSTSNNNNNYYYYYNTTNNNSSSNVNNTTNNSNITTSGGTLSTSSSNNSVIKIRTEITDYENKNNVFYKNLTDKMVERSLDEADKEKQLLNQKNADVELEFFSNNRNAENMTITIENKSLALIDKKSILNTTIKSDIVQINFDKNSVSNLKNQTSSNINISVSPYKSKFNIVERANSNKPIYNIKSEDIKSVTNNNNGTVTLGIFYNPKLNENINDLYVFSMDKNGIKKRVNNAKFKDGLFSFETTVNTLSSSTFGIASSAPVPFGDVNFHWAKDNIKFSTNLNLLEGKSVNSFEPDTYITRAEFIAALAKIDNDNKFSFASNTFRDVSKDNKYFNYVEWANKYKIAVGLSNDLFEPDGYITREQASHILVKYAETFNYNLNKVAEYKVFNDDDKISNWAKKSVMTLQPANIIVGKGDNMFDPLGNITKAESATILTKFIENIIL